MGDLDRAWSRHGGGESDTSESGGGQPGRRTLTMKLPARSSGSAPLVQRSAAPAATPAGPQEDPFDFSFARPAAAVDQVIGGSGAALPAAERGKYEAHLGADLGNVQLHTDAAAAQSAQAVGAKAYAVGSHVVFGEGQYDPGSRDGQHLLAHELTHVVQQGGGGERVQRQVDDAATGAGAGPKLRALIARLEQLCADAHEAGAAAAEASEDPLGKAHAVAEGLVELRAIAAGSDEQRKRDALIAVTGELTRAGLGFDDLAAAAPAAAPSPVQEQTSPALARKALEVSDPGDAAEVEADRVADAFVAGTSASISERGASGVQRDLLGAVGAATGAVTAAVTSPVGLVVSTLAVATVGLLWWRRSRQQARDAEAARAEQALQATLLANLNSTPIAAPDRDTIVEDVLRLAGGRRLEDLPALREHVDVLTQYVSDAVMKSGDARMTAEVKAPVCTAAVEIQRAYLLATMRRDYDGARAALIAGSDRLLGIDRGALAALLRKRAEIADEAREPKPKQREAGHRIDVGSMMLAQATVRDDFSPDLVVGLPTGGAHVASRYAATVGAISDRTPEMWLTRPQGVKAESKAFMEGVAEDQLLKPEELEHLVGRMQARGLRPGRDRVTIMIADDGQVSGTTLELTRQVYRDAFAHAGYETVIRTGLGLGGGNDEQDMLYPERLGGRGLPNHADYVVNNGTDRAGRRAYLADAPPQDVEGTRSLDPGTQNRDAQVEIVSRRDEHVVADKVTIRDLFSPPEQVDVEHH